ncbi:hypothetical protein GQ43DRAFT_365022 [Delitschia confertaspora ATCC 74209]|uniref:Stress-response A/B barrel domain-containing protein n=1 Tax=Delitschia confertaspora ATCC 74209 TaxID=1513339 RepID=A0A9P4JSA9_9PLEO|nr:hypothetical protein GQ43DRAFT_365022 [Delitschia confertaspora ATCC 74209]
MILLFLVSLLVTFHQTESNPFLWSIAGLVPTTSSIGPLVTHVVLFQFKNGVNPTGIKSINAQMLALKKTCKHPVTGKQYIKYISGGLDNSKEGLQNGMTHAFVLQFENTEDRDYYVDEDPAHAAFKKQAAAILEKSQVIDFKDNVFFPPASPKAQ